MPMGKRTFDGIVSFCVHRHACEHVFSFLGVFISWDTFLILWGLIMGKENSFCLVLSFILKVLLWAGIV